MIIALLAVAIGATIFFGLATIYIDIPQQMGQEFRSYGANMIFLPSEDGESISDETADKLKGSIPENDLVGMTPFRYENVRINELPFMAAGTDFEQVKKTAPYWYITGNTPSGEGEVLVGKDLADTVGAGEGSEISIKIETGNDKMEEFTFTVTGILQTGGNEEEYVFMSVADMERISGTKEGYDVFECSIRQSAQELKVLSDKLDKREEQLEESRKKLLVLKEDCSGLKEQLEENKNTISSLRKQLEDKNFIISDLNDDLDLLNEKLNSQNDDIIIDSEFLSNEQFTSSSNSYSFDDYVELQKEYIALLKKYERSQEDLYNEKVKVIHYKNLLDKFKNFILRIQ